MRQTALLAMMAILGGGISIAAESHATEPVVPICMRLGADLLPLISAQKLTSQMFAEIGVRLEWRRAAWCEAGDIVITISYDTPDDQLPGAWAYAMPFEGTHIVAFWDRVQRKMPPTRAPIILAHVLAHEITHILEGVARHSESGVMKATWTSADYFEMLRKPLPFTPVDVQLIHYGLEIRQASLLAANKSALELVRPAMPPSGLPADRQ